MRDLTKEELALAPDWAVEYSLSEISGVVRFHGGGKFSLCSGGELSWPLKCNAENFNTKPIARKPFDITKHEFSDSNFKDGAYIDEYGDLTVLASEYDIPCFLVNKQDAIAIAKALGVTGDDLK